MEKRTKSSTNKIIPRIFIKTTAHTINIPLESILKPMKFLDRKLQKQYTQMGQKIPEQHLYKITTTLGLLGIPASIFLPPPGHMICGFIVGTNIALDLEGLEGKLPTYISGESQVLNPMYESAMKITKMVRLPLFLMGIGFFGNVAYHGLNVLFNGELAGSGEPIDLISGIGFLSMSSSMYLKDQDPKLFKKQPSYVKAFFQKIYQKAKELIPSPNPSPEPVQNTYSILEKLL